MSAIASKRFMYTLLLVGALALCGSSAAWAADKDAEGPAAEKVAKAGDPYTLDFCPVSGEKIGAMGEPVVISHEGREIRFCCAGCEAPFKKEPEKYLSKVDEALIKQQKADYPLEHCIVMKEHKLDDKAVNLVYNNRLVRFCCADCIKEFKADPAKHIAMLDEAVIAKQKDKANTVCPVSGKEIAADGGENLVVGTKLVRFCCAGCPDKFKANPLKFMTKSDEPAAAGEAPKTGAEKRES